MSDAALHYAKVISDLNARWTPHPAQQLILNAIFRDGKRIVMLECGRKFGKTELDAYFLWRLALTNPGEYYYFTPLQNQGREIVWANRRLQSFGPEGYIDSINETEMRIRIVGPFGESFIKVDGSDNFDKYRGPNPKGAVYDEFRDFRPEFHDAFGPNLSTFSAPLLINGTPPQVDVPHYDAMMGQAKSEPTMAYFNYPSWTNPHVPRETLALEKRLLFARNDHHVWYREFGAERKKGGKNAYFSMLDYPKPERPHTKHVRPHAEVMAEVLRDKKKLIWQVVCDPGSSSVFCVNFRAINPHTKKVYRLGEIYETSIAETSTSRIVPRIKAMKEELCPGYEAFGIEWDQHYDEAATWFAVEAENSFDETFTPTNKASSDKDDGISLLQDQLLHGLTVFSDRCINGVKEYENFIRDPATNKPKAGCARHYLDTERYGNSLAGVDLRPEAEPPEPDPLLRPRFRTPEQDLDDDRDDDFPGLDF